jgi:hypothetical protein
MALYSVVTGNVALAADLNQIVNLLNGATSGVDVVISSRIRAQMTGSTAASGYIGGMTTGAPTTGTQAAGDFVVTQDGVIWICTAPGTPGTFVRAGVVLTNSAANIKDVAAAAVLGSRADAAPADHQHSWATMIAASLSWGALNTFTQGIALPSFNGSSFAGTAYPAVIAFGSKARQIFTAASRNDTFAAAGDILVNA